MWIYDITKGTVSRDGKVVGKGYSGWDDGDNIPEPGEGKNDPTAQPVKGVGPIPVGKWKFGAPFFHTKLELPYCLRLYPQPGTVTHGRSGLLIHGDSRRRPGTASHGCVVLPRSVRMALWESGDHELMVISGVEAVTNVA